MRWYWWIRSGDKIGVVKKELGKVSLSYLYPWTMRSGRGRDMQRNSVILRAVAFPSLGWQLAPCAQRGQKKIERYLGSTDEGCLDEKAPLL